eukprot:gene1956-2395_t
MSVQLTTEQLRQNFDKFDVDKNGTLDKVELRKVLVDTLKRPVNDHLFNMYIELQFNASDKDFNGVIDFNEFQSLISKINDLPIHLKPKEDSTQSPSNSRLESGENAPKVKKEEFTLQEADIAEARRQFDKYDLDKSGTIDRSELKNLLKETVAKRMGDMMVSRLVESHMQLADKDGSGTIDFDEFLIVYAKTINQTVGAVPMPGLVPTLKRA